MFVGRLVIAGLVVASCASTPAADPEQTTTTTAVATPATSTTTPVSTTIAPSTTVGMPTTPTTPAAQAWTNDALRSELLEMMRQDQIERTGEGLPPGTKLPPMQDRTRAARLAEIVAEFGWPTYDLVGVDGGTAAWLIAQHADHDVDQQAEWLTLLEEAVAEGQADPTELAYLTDRVAVNLQQPQQYGTQIRCRAGVPAPATPIEDAATVDTRRGEVGLGTLDAYYAELSMMCAQEAADGQGPAG